MLHAGEDWYRIDRNSTSGAEVTAIANGVVYDYTPAWNYPGKAVVIKHLLPNGNYIYSVYMHLNDDVSVVTGLPVVRGQRIGSVLPQTYDGRFPAYHSTDDSHLHFEIRTFASASNIYTDHPSCNHGDAPGRGYTYPTFPPDSYPSSSNHYTDPGTFLYSHAGVFLPIIKKASCVEGAQLIGNGGFEQGNAYWNEVNYYMPRSTRRLSKIPGVLYPPQRRGGMPNLMFLPIQQVCLPKGFMHS